MIKEVIKLEYIKSLKNVDYKEYWEYIRMDEVLEIIRGHFMLSTKDKIVAIPRDNALEFFVSVNDKLIVDYRIVIRDDKFVLFEMTMKTWDKWENYVRELDI